MFILLRLFAGFTGFTLVRLAWQRMQEDRGITYDLAKCSPETLQSLYELADKETQVMIKSYM